MDKFLALPESLKSQIYVKKDEEVINKLATLQREIFYAKDLDEFSKAMLEHNRIYAEFIFKSVKEGILKGIHEQNRRNKEQQKS